MSQSRGGTFIESVGGGGAEQLYEEFRKWNDHESVNTEEASAWIFTLDYEVDLTVSCNARCLCCTRK